MIVFVDGFQNTGKSTLIDKCEYIHNRFPFNQYLEHYYLLDSKEELNGFQLAKDLGMLFALQYTKEDIVFDRGPLSTIFYSLKEMRYGKRTNEILVKFMNDLKEYKNCRYIFITKKNAHLSKERIHNDGFDYLDDDNDIEKERILDSMISTAKQLDINIILFENDFSKSIKENQEKFNELLRGLMNEHDRN